jgi:hypothetical protein
MPFTSGTATLVGLSYRSTSSGAITFAVEKNLSTVVGPVGVVDPGGTVTVNLGGFLSTDYVSILIGGGGTLVNMTLFLWFEPT